MIDLDQAARELTASVAHVHPDLPRVQATAGRRLRRRRTVLAVAAVAVLVAGGAAALAATAGTGDGEQVHAGPTPGRGAPRAGDLVDYGRMRITVPEGWVSVTTDAYPEGACDAEGLITVGPEVVVPAACRDLPAIDVRNGAQAGETGPIETRTVGGIEIQLVAERADGTQVWAVPALDGSLTATNGADPTAVLDSIEPSGREVALTDATSGRVPAWVEDPGAWQTIRFEGVQVRVPATWPKAGHRVAPDPVDEPCRAWVQTGPSVVTGASGNPRCEDGRSWVPRDGLWMLPLDVTQIDAGFDLNDPLTIDERVLTVIWDVRMDVLEIVVPGDGDRPDVLVRIGLGVDGSTAGSILSSIRVTGEPSDAAIALSCGPIVVADRATLDLPEDLDVSLLQGMGGSNGNQENPCAVNLTATDDPGRHISFVKSSLAGDADQVIDGVRDVRWGPIHEGYGAELVAQGSDETISVVAYGVTEAEAERLFTSLASSS